MESNLGPYAFGDCFDLMDHRFASVICVSCPFNTRYSPVLTVTCPKVCRSTDIDGYIQGTYRMPGAREPDKPLTNAQETFIY